MVFLRWVLYSCLGYASAAKMELSTAAAALFACASMSWA
jgi:hypothetical protein